MSPAIESHGDKAAVSVFNTFDMNFMYICIIISGVF